jgi:hypothetical protein
MIVVTRLDKQLMYLNPDHIICIEETPDTVITLCLHQPDCRFPGQNFSPGGRTASQKISGTHQNQPISL